MSDAIDEAKAVLDAMKKAAPGPHIAILERGFGELWNLAADHELDHKILDVVLPYLPDSVGGIRHLLDIETPRSIDEWSKLFGVQVTNEYDPTILYPRASFINFIHQAHVTVYSWSPLAEK